MEEYFEGVSYRDVEVLGNFQLSTDTPSNYCDKLAIINQSRAFPDQSYPSRADPEHDPAAQGLPVPAASGAFTSSSASGSVVPSTSAPDSSVKELHDTLITHHHSVVKLLENAGIKDVCSLYKGSRVDKMLMSLGPKKSTA